MTEQTEQTEQPGGGSHDSTEDTIATDELMRLAELCGKPSVETDVAMPTRIRFVDHLGLYCCWQPHLDANQRDEVVEALGRDNWYVSVDSESTCRMACMEREPICVKDDTPGLAVCRAALKVIGGKG